MQETDFLIIGSGVAGLYTAIKIAQQAPDKNITVLSKKGLGDTNTSLAQGGMAVVMSPDDSNTLHIQDTLNAGAGLCKKEAVIALVSETKKRVDELLSAGLVIDKKENGEPASGLEGGHSRPRILHKGDNTGAELQQTLIRLAKHYSKISLVENTTAIDFLCHETCDSDNNSQMICTGALVLSNEQKQLEKIVADATIVATGGLGQLFSVTSNHKTATGDGVAMAFRAGATISDLEFIQFHPTLLNAGGLSASRHELISEAVRGAGARLVNGSGQYFMTKYNLRGDLATRDVVSRAISSEFNKGEKVFLDCSAMAEEEFRTSFPTVSSLLEKNSISYNKIPVCPGAHYACGGIETDLNGATNIVNLYAVGECACTGVHGANRLASNSLTEALVFASKCADHAVKHADRKHCKKPAGEIKNDFSGEPITAEQIAEYRNEIRKSMSAAIGTCTSNRGIRQAIQHIIKIKETIKNRINYLSEEDLEIRNMCDTAMLVLSHSAKRTGNLGTFYNTDNEHDTTTNEMHGKTVPALI